MLDKFVVSINGAPLPGAVYGDILDITVDTDVFQPGMFTILLSDGPVIPGQPLLKYADNKLLFMIGAKVQISAMAQKPGNPIPVPNILIMGEVTAIEPHFRDDGKVQMLIRGYDAAHRLTLGKKTRAWGTGLAPTVTEMEIVAKIAQENGLVPVVNPAGLVGVIYDYVMQYNQSDWDFLWSRARLFGYQVYVVGNFLNFAPAAVPRQLVPVDLMWGANLRNFRPRFVTAGAATMAIAQGWNGDLTNEMFGPSVPGLNKLDPPSSPTVSKLFSGSQSILTGFQSKAKDFVLEPIVQTPAIGTVVANARQLQHESRFVAASGECDGNPLLVAGSQALVVNVGVQFAGTYFVTQARHTFRGSDYKVTFEVSGRNPYTFSHLLGKDPEINKIYGAVIGVVIDINDPLMLGRIKVRYPWLPPDPLPVTSDWARLASMGSGLGGGVYFSPALMDEVLVVFEQGDVNRPYIVGSLWNSRQRPPRPAVGTAVVAGQVTQRVIRSPMGHMVVMDDTPGKESILMQDRNGSNIKIDSVKNEITFQTLGNMTINVGGKFSLIANGGFDIKTTANGVINAAAGMGIKVGPVSLDLTPGNAALKAPQVAVEGQAQTSIKGGAMVEIQGALVKIN
jgi:phage protein D